MSGVLAELGIKIEIASWRNIVPNVWSLHIRDAHSPMCFTNGKGATKESALASALGEYIERLNCNHFYNDQFWGETSPMRFVHYPDERWFKPGRDALPKEILDAYCLDIYNPDGELRARTCRHQLRQRKARHLLAALRAPVGRRGGVFPVQPDRKPVPQQRHERRQHLAEAQVQCLSEIFERAVKREILEGEIACPTCRRTCWQIPGIVAGIEDWKSRASGAGQGCVAGRRVSGDVRDPDEPAHRRRVCLLRRAPELGGGAGAQPDRTAAGRSFEGLNDLPQPTFESNAVTEPNNFVEHFIDSSGVVSWRFFSAKADYEFVEWDFSGHGENSNARKPRRCSASSRTWARKCTWRCTTSSAPPPAASWCRAIRRSIRSRT
jgi:ribosomal protein S12 methylthiotransferase accessory factor